MSQYPRDDLPMGMGPGVHGRTPTIKTAGDSVPPAVHPSMTTDRTVQKQVNQFGGQYAELYGQQKRLLSYVPYAVLFFVPVGNLATRAAVGMAASEYLKYNQLEAEDLFIAGITGALITYLPLPLLPKYILAGPLASFLINGSI